MQNRRNVQVGSLQSSGPHLLVAGCTRTKQTIWTEDQFTVTSSVVIRNREKRVADIVVSKASYRSMGTTGDPVPVGQRDVPVNHFTG